MPKGKVKLCIYLCTSQSHRQVNGHYQKASFYLLGSLPCFLLLRGLVTTVLPGEEPHKIKHYEFEGKIRRPHLCIFKI